MLQRLLAIAFLTFSPYFASAAPLIVDTGVDSNVPTILQGIVNVLLGWSGLAATGLFLLGSIIMVGSGGEEAFLSAGKKIMKAALIGFALILGSWLMLSTVIFFISL